MLLWVGDLIAWQRQGSTPYRQGTLTSLICTVQQWIGGYRALRGVEDQGLPQRKSKKERQQDRKELIKERVLNKYQLDQDPPQQWVRAWTDGSQQEGRQGGQFAGYGVWFGLGHPSNPARPPEGQRQTNNQAEIRAVIEGITVVPVGVPLQICSDSGLVVDGITKWMEDWERRGWRTRGGKEVQNKDLWKQMRSLLQGREAPTVLIKVPSHVNIQGNKHANRLADEAARKTRSRK